MAYTYGIWSHCIGITPWTHILVMKRSHIGIWSHISWQDPDWLMVWASIYYIVSLCYLYDGIMVQYMHWTSVFSFYKEQWAVISIYGYNQWWLWLGKWPIGTMTINCNHVYGGNLALTVWWCILTVVTMTLLLVIWWQCSLMIVTLLVSHDDSDFTYNTVMKKIWQWQFSIGLPLGGLVWFQMSHIILRFVSQLNNWWKSNRRRRIEFRVFPLVGFCLCLRPNPGVSICVCFSSNVPFIVLLHCCWYCSFYIIANDVMMLWDECDTNDQKLVYAIIKSKEQYSPKEN